jgi:DNA gyrase/topoisomerase IV subunit A
VRLQDLLSSQQRQLQIVLQEAQAVADKHGTPRRSRIVVGTSAAVPWNML